jgi:hypothetical protein
VVNSKGRILFLLLLSSLIVYFTIMKNPSLSYKPRHESASVIPMKQETSLLEWLKDSGRLIPREAKEADLLGDEDEEISELMEVDDTDLDDDDMLLDD